jgi:hypothetical protein
MFDLKAADFVQSPKRKKERKKERGRKERNSSLAAFIKYCGGGGWRKKKKGEGFCCSNSDIVNFRASGRSWEKKSVYPMRNFGKRWLMLRGND